MSLPKQPARAQATVHKIMILLSMRNRYSQNNDTMNFSDIFILQIIVKFINIPNSSILEKAIKQRSLLEVYNIGTHNYPKLTLIS